jgi:hypothetical protein
VPAAAAAADVEGLSYCLLLSTLSYCLLLLSTLWSVLSLLWLLLP